MKEFANAYFSQITGAFVHYYKPIRIYIYNHQNYPYATLNPLVKSLLFNDARYNEGKHLFTLSGDKDKSDFFVFPCDLNYFEAREEEIDQHLEFFRGNEERHIFFDHRDQPTPYPLDTSIRFKVSLQKKQVSDSLICIPYMEVVDNLFWYLHETRHIKYQLSFIGERTDFREAMVDALDKFVPNSYFCLRDTFFHGNYLSYCPEGKPKRPVISPAVKLAQRKEFIDISLQSKFILALRGYGLNSFRFFEALSMGLPPVLVSDDCALPYENIIDYDQFCFRIEGSDIPTATEQIQELLSAVNEKKYKEMCQMARFYYDSYLSAKNSLYLLYNHLQKIGF